MITVTTMEGCTKVEVGNLALFFDEDNEWVGMRAGTECSRIYEGKHVACVSEFEEVDQGVLNERFMDFLRGGFDA